MNAVDTNILLYAVDEDEPANAGRLAHSYGSWGGQTSRC